MVAEQLVNNTNLQAGGTMNQIDLNNIIQIINTLYMMKLQPFENQVQIHAAELQKIKDVVNQAAEELSKQTEDKTNKLEQDMKKWNDDAKMLAGHVEEFETLSKIRI